MLSKLVKENEAEFESEVFSPFAIPDRKII